MAVTLNANTSTGFIATSDTSGVLQLQTGGTAAVTVDASQNVGIGTNSPTTTLDVKAAQGRIKLASSTGTNNALVLFNNTGGNAWVGLDSSAGSLTSAYALNLYHEGAYPITFSTNGTERMRIDSSGNVGIGTSSPSYKLDVAGFSRGAIVHRSGSYTNGATTPSVSGATYFVISNSSPTTITNFTNAEDGQIIYLYFGNSNTTIDRSNCYLAGGVNFVSTAADVLVLLKSGSYWFEVSRSVNS